MHSSHVLATAGAAVLLVIAPAFAETPAQAPARIRGTITAIEHGSVTVTGRDGRILTLTTGPYTTYAYVVPSSLDAIKVKDFVGSAVKGPPSSMVAFELAIVPENMRAGRISLYGWDPLPDPTARRTDITATRMTNGLVSGISPWPTDLTNTKMTNGAVSAETGGAAGLTLTVTYDGGSKSFRIAVPPNAPIVRYILTDRSALAIESAVMIKTNPRNQAGLVTIGKSVTPPM
ncbi:MAG: hypothetical protein JWL65_5721 [Gammaproteobacteria bacterium]|nr:hypothetical protein [Gammaproteobacteria bacterium]